MFVFSLKVLELGLENHEAFQTGNKLIIDGTKYQIIVDAPTVIRLSLPKVIISGERETSEHIANVN